MKRMIPLALCAALLTSCGGGGGGSDGPLVLVNASTTQFSEVMARPTSAGEDDWQPILEGPWLPDGERGVSSLEPGSWDFMASSADDSISDLGVSVPSGGRLSLFGPRARSRALAAGALIVDNGSGDAWFGGNWQVATSAADKFGSSYVYSAAAGAHYNFNATPNGRYEVYAWWTAAASRSQAVRMEIQHAAGTATVTVNQRLNGGQWNLLGTFDFDGSLVRVRVLSDGVNGLWTVADAAAWSPASGAPPPPPPPPATGEIVIDDSTAGTAKNGNWTKSGAPNPFGTQSLYANRAGAWYSWTRAIAEPTDYEVFVWWTEWPSRERNVPYEVAAAAGPVLVMRDQLTGGGRWQSLGVYSFGSQVKVTVRCPGTKTVAADAVRFVPSSEPPPPPPPPPPPTATDLSVAWDAPALNADGTPCTDLAGFKIEWGPSPGDYGAPEDVGAATTATIEDLAPGTYYIAASAYDQTGNVGARSAPLVKTVP
jgi:hypothetical protein